MKMFSDAAAQNFAPIADVLGGVFPERGRVLEVASGSGQHAAAFARAFPSLEWQPSESDPTLLESITAYREECGLPNLHVPLFLDAAAEAWPLFQADALLNVNMIHIAPWSACEGLFRGAGRILHASAPLVLYGPFRVEGVFTAPSNARFDAMLRDQDSRWGVRDTRDVEALAADCGFTLDACFDMPANNFTLVFRKEHLMLHRNLAHFRGST